MSSALRFFAALFLSATFLLAGSLKVWAPDRFLLDVRSFELLPAWLAYGTALTLPWLEVFAAVGLWSSRLARGSALLLGLSALSFILALTLAEWRGLELDCGCFGDWLVFPHFAAHLAFNLALATAATLLLIRKRPPPAVPFRRPSVA
jgi:putative oxidoreductase